MNRAALIDQIQQATETLEKLLTLLQSAPLERDRSIAACSAGQPGDGEPVGDGRNTAPDHHLRGLVASGGDSIHDQ
jgi:hypothetical protein